MWAAVQSLSPANRGRLCVLAAALGWSLSGVIVKGLELPSLTIALYRSLFAGLALLPLVPRPRRRLRRAMLPCCLAFAAMIGLYIGAIKNTTAANAIFLQCTATFWLIPLGYLVLRERPDRRAVAGILVATAGIAAIVLWGFDHGRPSEVMGVVQALLSGVAFACVVVGLRSLRDIDSIWLSVVNNLGGCVVLAVWLLLTTHRLPTPGSLAQTLTLIAFGVVQMAIPYALFAYGLRETNAAEAGLIGLLEPVLNPIWVLLVLGERPAPATLVGGMLLLVGVAIRYVPVARNPTPDGSGLLGPGDDGPPGGTRIG